MTTKAFQLRMVLALTGLAMVATKTAESATPEITKVVSIGAASHEGNGIAIDAEGNIFLTGQHQPSRYDSNTATLYAELGGIEYVSNRQTEFFLMKLDADLDVLWTRVGGSAQYDYGTAVRVAANGDAVVVAAYQDEFEIDGQTLGNVTSGRTDSFVARYDTSGNLLWTQTATGAEDVTADDVEIDNEGSIYITGRMRGLATFGTSEIGQSSQNRVFLAKYSGAGELQWAEEVIGTSDVGSAALGIDGNDNVIVGGTLNSGARGVFLASYNTSGSRNWISQFDTGRTEELSDIAVDNDGNIVFSGRFSGNTFDLGNGVSLTRTGTFFEGYVAMVDADRTPQWIVPSGTRGYEFEPDAEGNLVVAGYHQSPVLDFAGETLTDGLGGTDAYVGSVARSGAVNWSVPWASDLNELARAIAIGPGGSIVVTGEGRARTFGLEEYSGSVFVAKLGGGGEVRPSVPELSISIDGNAIQVSWPETEGNYQLQTAASLDGAFGTATATPVDGRPNTYRIEIAGSTLFIRLKEIRLR